MCGVIGCVRQNEGYLVSDLLSLLNRLSHRGYDSSGVASNTGYLKKAVGEISNLISIVKKEETFKVGIAHSRWCTHGGATVENAHPHVSGRVTIVHNGILSNYDKIKAELESYGCVFNTPVDSEAIAVFFDYYLSKGYDIHYVIRMFFSQIEGEFAALVMIKNCSELYVLKRGSPVFAGIAKDQIIVASDIYAFRQITPDVIPFDDDEYAIVTQDEIQFFDKFSNGISKTVEHLTFSDSNDEADSSYEHFMLKEIEEQPRAVERVIENTQLNPDLKKMARLFNSFEKIVFLGCGTSYHAGLFVQAIFEKYFIDLSGQQFYSVIASEFDSFNYIDADTLVVALSQSGETMDVIKAIKVAKEKGAEIVSLVNVPHSTIWRMSSFSLDICAGQEVAVASTKAWTNQVVTLLMILREMGTDIRKDIEIDLNTLPQVISKTINLNRASIQKISKMLADEDRLIVLGRGLCYPAAKELALKIEEICYVFTKALMSAELKHGPISLISREMVDTVVNGRVVKKEKRTPVISLIPHSDKASAATKHEVETRGANFITISDTCPTDLLVTSKDEIAFGIGAVVIGQLLSYYTAIEKGTNIDKPRNLAKSVTVV